MKTPTILFTGTIAAFTVLTAMPALADPVYATRIVNVRSGPGLNYEAVDQLVADEPVDKGNCNSDGTWCYIRHEGTNGWVAAVFLSATPPGQQSTPEPTSQPATGADSDYRVVRKVNVRTGPSTDYAVVDQLDAGEIVTRGQCSPDGTWCYVGHDGADGWVSASFLIPVNQPAPPVTPPSGDPGTTRIAISQVNIRTGPSTNFVVVDRLEGGETVELAQCNSDNTWCYVSHDGPDGWVAASYLRVPSQPGPGPGGPGNGGPGPGVNPPATVTQKVGTTITGMPVRGAPTLFTSTVGRLNRGETIPVESCTADGYWCHVVNDTVDGWVPSAFLQISEIEVPAPATSNQAVAARATPVRQGPGSNFALVGMLPMGTTVDVERCGPGGNWCKVSYGANTGWVSADALRAPEATPVPPAGQQPPNALCFTGFGGIEVCLSQ